MRNKSSAFSYFLEKVKFSNSRLLTTKKIISTILAIGVALLLATTIAFVVSYPQWRPETYAEHYKYIWATLLTHGFALDVKEGVDKLKIFNTLFCIMGILIVSALAFIVAFKAGLFNMGVSGQMFAGAIAATFVAHKLSLPVGISQVVMLLVAIAVATVIAVAIGAMKVFLNVNEVVSSIMLNWFIYFIGIMLLSRESSPGNPIIPQDNLYTKSLDLENTFCISSPQTTFIVILILTFICVVFVSLFLKFTVAGKKQVATGLSKTASVANGYNVKLNVIGAMIISGILAGVLGCMVYCGKETQMPVTAVTKTIPQEGFNGIAVGLIAMNNPIACVPIAFLFALIQESGLALNSIGIDPNIPQVIFGIVVYGAAAIALFMNIKPYWSIVKIFKGKNYSVVKNNHNLSKIIFIDIVNEQLMLLNKNYVSYLSLIKTNGTLKPSCSSKIQSFFATIRNKICFWWLSRVKKLSETQLRQNQHLNKLQNLRIYHTNRIAVIKTNMIQKEAYEKTSKWFSDNFGIQHIASKQELKIIKKAFYRAYFIVNQEIDKFYDKAYKVLKENRKHSSLDKLEIRYDENLIPQIYFDCVKKELKKTKMPAIFVKTTHWQKNKRSNITSINQSSNELLLEVE